MKGRMHIDSASSLRRCDIPLLLNESDIHVSSEWEAFAYTDENWNVLADVIQRTTTLQKLRLRSGATDALGNDKVINAIARNRTIKILDVWSAGCGNDGAKGVAAALKENARIERINLDRNNISREGAKAIAEALKENKTLRQIDLSENIFGVKGARAIAKALKENITLQIIHLHGNSIGDKGAYAIAEAIKENRSLVKLWIGSNNISEVGGKDILNALRQIESSDIREIDLWGNEISQKTMEKIDEQINQIIHRTRIIKAMEAKTKQLQSTITQLHKELELKDEDMARKDKEIGELQSTIESIRGKAAEQDEKIAAIRVERSQIMQQIGDQQATIDELHGNIAAQDKEIASLGLERSQTTQQLVEQQSTIAELNGEIIEQKEAATLTISHQHSLLAQKDDNIAKKDKEIAFLRFDRSQMLQQLEELKSGSEVLGNYTKCCVCLEPYEVDSKSTSKKRLPIKSATCAHSLCEGCLDAFHASLMNGRSTLRYVRCPQCNDKSKKAFDIQNKVVDFFLREYIQCRKRKRLA